MVGKKVEFHKRSDGTLVIELLPEGKVAITELLDDKGIDALDDPNVFLDIIEHQLCNGWEVVRPEEIGALTSGLIISDDLTRDDDGKLTVVGTVYWDSRYETYSLANTLYTTGRCEMVAKN